MTKFYVLVLILILIGGLPFTRICSVESEKYCPKKEGEKVPERSAARFIKKLVCDYLHNNGFKKEYIESIV